MKKLFAGILSVLLVLSLLPKPIRAAQETTRWDVKNPGNVTGQDIADRARYYIGALRYSGSDYRTRTGFTEPQMFDCSGFVYRVCRDVGLGSTRKNYNIGAYDNEGKPLEGQNASGYYYITAHTKEQRFYGEELTEAVARYRTSQDYSGFQPGDLLFLDYNGDQKTDHATVYVGDGKVVHSSSSKGVVETKLSQNGWYGHTMGHWVFAASRLITCEHTFNNVGVCGKCQVVFDFDSKFTPICAGQYRVVAAQGVYLRTEKPYEAATERSKLISADTEVEVLGHVTNAHGELWYQVSWQGVIGYAPESALQWVRYGEAEFTCTLTTPAEGATIPQASYNVTGTITSKYPMERVEAYLDGQRFASIAMDNAISLNIRTSAINRDLSFSKLSPGGHTLTITAKDIHHGEVYTLINRNFITEGKVECTHSYENGVCTLCGMGEMPCGEQMYWHLAEGKLRIFGQGAMEDFRDSAAPWERFRDLIESVVIESGPVYIGEYAFVDCENLKSVEFSETVKTIANDAFSYCPKLKLMIFSGQAPSFGDYCFGGVVSEAYYPEGDATWDTPVLQNYGGQITWIGGMPGQEPEMPDYPGQPSGAGDCNADGIINNEDVAYLLWHTLFPEDYPLPESADFTGDGAVNNDDVAYLLWHTLFPEDYPI